MASFMSIKSTPSLLTGRAKQQLQHPIIGRSGLAQPRCWTRRQVGIVAASRKQQPLKQRQQEKPERTIDLIIVNRTISMQTYIYLEILVLVAQLGLADAAYSGDWSRIGIISTETEDVLKLVVQFIVVAHSLVALGCTYVATQRGLNPGLSAVKGFLFGSMALYEILQDESGTSS